MIVVVDANIIISALLNPKGTITHILLQDSEKFEFIAPAFLKDEIHLHKKRICTYSQMDEQYFTNALSIYFQHILFFGDETIDRVSRETADVLTASIDYKDAVYVALALALGGLLWTGDKKLEKGLNRKKYRNTVNTSQLLQIMKGL